MAFVEYSKGGIGLLDMVNSSSSVVSQGTTIIKEAWIFDYESETLVDSSAGD